jgi:hypothetical protein
VRNTARSTANLWPRAAARSVMTARQAVSSCSRSNTGAGPIRRTAIFVASSDAVLSTTALAANRAPERSNHFTCPLARSSSTRTSVAIHLLANLIALAPPLDDLLVGSAAIRDPLAEIHRAAPWCAQSQQRITLMQVK